MKRPSIKSFLLCSIIAAVLAGSVFCVLTPGKDGANAIGYSWTQADWSLGADIAAIATYTLNQTGWQKYYSKTANVTTATANQIKLSSASPTIAQTSDADFNGGTVGNGLYEASGSVSLQKQNGRACTLASQCASAYCSSVCADFPYISASGLTGCSVTLSVAGIDISGTKQWKTTNDACISPQCSGSPATLVADNAVDFSLYPARNACKAIGGRLPTRVELATCIYPNKTSLGNNFQSNYYWSSEEFTATLAYSVSLSNGSTSSNNKTVSYYVRCVVGQ